MYQGDPLAHWLTGIMTTWIKSFLRTVMNKTNVTAILENIRTQTCGNLPVILSKYLRLHLRIISTVFQLAEVEREGML